MVQQPLQDGRREHVVAEDVAPLGHDLVRRDEHAPPLVPSRHKLEEEVRAPLLEGQVAQLVAHRFDAQTLAFAKKYAIRTVQLRV